MIWDHLIFESCFLLSKRKFRSLKCISFKKVENNYEDQVGPYFEKIIKRTTQLVDPCADSLCFSGPPVLWQLRENPFAVLGGVKVCEVHLPLVSNYSPPPVSTKFSTNREVSERFVGQVPSVRNSLSRNFLLDRSTRCFSSATAKGGYFTPTVSREPL